jgi:hypothetical protein
MRKLLASVFVATLISVPSTIPIARADPEECRDAIDKYKSAIDDVSEALRRYANCISNSRGHDDCSSEFRRLRNAQDDFESAVSAYESDCD